MPNLVNNDTNPDSKLVNYYLNYVTPVVQGEPLFTNGGVDLSGLLTAAWGDVRTAWTKHATTNAAWALRFPGITETLTGNIGVPTTSALTANCRSGLQFTSNACMTLNATNGTTNTTLSFTTTTAIASSNSYVFAVVNAYAIMMVGFTTTGRTSCNWNYQGWIRNGAFTSTQFPRNLVGIRGTHSAISGITRVQTENSTTAQSLYSTSDLGGSGILNPAVDCTVTTSGADTIEIMLRDNVSPYNYIGQPYFLIQGPASLTVGKIYKNNSMSGGRDWEGSDNAFWMCIGVWGGRKLLMRVWTEGIT